MTRQSSGEDTTSAASEKRERIRAAIAGHYDELCRAVRPLVRSVARGRSAHEIERRVEDVLAEVTSRALHHPERYDPDRRPLPWLIGIAGNVIRGEVRDAATGPRRVDLDDAAWERVAGVLDPPDESAAARLDADQMLARLSPEQRRALECRYQGGLDGERLAEAIGAPTPNAARQRVFRAVQALRDLFATEVSR